MSAPTGTATFLFTDIEGSTHRWEAFPSAMRLALARHDAILRSAIEAAGGTVFKTVGDAFCAVFSGATEAAAAAVAAQQALAAEEWDAAGEGFGTLKVRMALHAGAADEREGDWFGPTVNRVARLLSAAHGGQVLISGSVEQALRPAGLSEGLRLLDLGEHRLKDLARPEHIWQLLAPDLPAEFPPILTLDRLRHNLPVQLSSFVGRERELAAVVDVLDGERLVTLTGVGGTGKTRLALQVAGELVEAQADGVWFVDLAPLSAGAQVAGAVAAALGLPDRPGMSVEDALAEWLLRRRLLLILDNCEHVIADAAILVERLLRDCPGLRILATSREALRLPGERQLPLSPLAAPDPAAYGGRSTQAARSVTVAELDRLARFEAVRLFVDRARTLRPEFTIDRENAGAVAAICARLDGIPLAIELAAARVTVLPPAEIASRLDDRFRLLARGSRTALPRQQTLRALINWSYELLRDDERQTLRRLSLFRGPAPLAACEAACAGGGVAADDVLDALASLVDKSLVLAEEQDGSPWYRLLETIREYGADRLVEAGDGDEARRELLAWSIGATDRRRLDRGAVAGPRLAVELDLLRPTLMDLLAWAVAAPGQSAGAVSLAGGRWTQAWRFGRWREVRPLLAAALDYAAAGAAPEDLAWLLYEFAVLGGEDGTPAAAITYYRRAAEAFRAVGERQGEAWAVQDEGHAWTAQGDIAAYLDCQERALVLKQAWNAPAFDLGVTMANMGDAHRNLGHEDQALFWNEEAVRLQEAEGLTGFAHLALSNAGHILLKRGRVAEARARFEQAQGVDSAHTGWASLAGLAGVAAARGAPRRALRLQAAAGRILEDNEWILGGTDLGDWSRIDGLIRSLLDDAVHTAVWAEGWAMSPESMAAYALGPDVDEAPKGPAAAAAEGACL